MEQGLITKAEAAREMGYSWPGFHRRYLRFKEEGLEGLIDGRRFNRRPPTISSEQEEALLSLKRSLPSLSCRALLGRLPPELRDGLSPKKVERLLKKHGLGRRRKQSPSPPSTEEAPLPKEPDELWHLVLAGAPGGRLGSLELVLLLDGASGFILGAELFQGVRAEKLLPFLISAIERWGAPRALSTDRRPLFRASRGEKGATQLEKLLFELMVFHVLRPSGEKGLPQRAMRALSLIRSRLWGFPHLRSLAQGNDLLRGSIEALNSESRPGIPPPRELYRKRRRRIPLVDLRALSFPLFLRRVGRDGSVRFRHRVLFLPARLAGEWVEVRVMGEELALYLEGERLAGREVVAPGEVRPINDFMSQKAILSHYP
ncbi:MAG: helix-turn-helix domain-containing protein [Nitrospinota bacterium]